MTTETICAVSKPQLKRPPLYKVVFMDDDITTMQCVIDILVSYFNKTDDDAYELMMQVHLVGNAVAGTYCKDIAETKIAQANAELKVTAYPLRIELHKVL